MGYCPVLSLKRSTNLVCASSSIVRGPRNQLSPRAPIMAPSGNEAPTSCNADSPLDETSVLLLNKDLEPACLINVFISPPHNVEKTTSGRRADRREISLE